MPKSLFLVLVLVLGLALTQNTSPPIILSALPPQTSSPRLSVTADVGLLPGQNRIRVVREWYNPATRRWESVSASSRTTYTPLPTLADAYYLRIPIGYQKGGVEDQTSIRRMIYRPWGVEAGLSLDLPGLSGPGDTREPGDSIRVVDPGSYRGWGIISSNKELSGVHTSRSDAQFMKLRLTRAATVCVAWYGQLAALPGWLGGWAPKEPVVVSLYGGSRTQSLPVLCKGLPAGEHWLGGLEGKGRWVYEVLLAEASGKPSPKPSVPNGFEVPKPNALCPAWVHDQYTVQGFDGKTYPTWHPQVDPVYWCYFGHEHGSRPTQFPQVASLIQNGEMKIAFDYPIRTALATEKAACQNCHLQKLGREVKESRNFTFKMFALDRDGYLWISQAQMGSGDVSRLCVRHHQYDLWVVNKASGELVASLHYVADTGQAINNSVGADRPYRPPLCPEQADEPSGRNRRIPSYDAQGGLGPGGYESWQFEFPRTLGFVGYRVYATDNPQTRCRYAPLPDGTWGCPDTPRSPNPIDYGENRWFVAFDDSGSGGSTARFGVDAARALAQGVFCTNPFGTELRDCNAPGAIRQYIKPGLRVTHSGVDRGRFIPYDMWDVQYRHGEGYDADHNIEGGLLGPN